MTTPRLLPELLGCLAWSWGPTGTATITTLSDYPDGLRVRLVVTDPASTELGTELLDIVLDDSTHTVTGSVRWDLHYILVDQIYDPIRADYVHGEPSISGWELDTTCTGYLQAMECGYIDYGPHEPPVYPLSTTPGDWERPERPTRAPRRPAYDAE